MNHSESECDDMVWAGSTNDRKKEEVVGQWKACNEKQELDNL